MASLGKRLLLGSFGAGVVLVLSCGSPPAKPPVVPVSDRCPDITKADDVAAFDFVQEHALSRAAADRMKAAILAGLEVEALAEKLDADLGIACAQIVHDLGKGGDYHSGLEACTAAVKAVQEARAKLGPKTQTQLVVRKPMCLVDASLVTKCASLCDSSVPSEKAKSECAESAGRCDGDCEGGCEPKGPASCGGTCEGTCEGTIKGTCGGRCTGTCDGKKVNGPCLGVCAGTCASAVEAECKGLCNGTCRLTKAGICGDGVCAGKCTVELADPKCAGEFSPPAVSAECRARCDLAVMNKTECGLPQVGYLVVSPSAKDAEAMKAAIDKAFPALLKILAELGPQGAARVQKAQQLIDAARASFKEIARSGGNAPAAEAQLRKCFEEPFKKAVAAAAAAKSSIDQATGVRDEATKAPAPAP
ncbi:MAG: hypothetical protein KIT84_21700 [Labilithrix sp.]|nr:hypothetical protein [Labilithrix sp.]MCW5813659.1 hypothetical protein [Labilithrix sp.]